MRGVFKESLADTSGYFGFSVLSFEGVEDGGREGFFVVDMADAATLGPPVFPLWIELFLQAARRPGLQIDANLFRRCLYRRHHDMHVIGAAVDGM